MPIPEPRKGLHPFKTVRFGWAVGASLRTVFGAKDKKVLAGELLKSKCIVIVVFNKK